LSGCKGRGKGRRREKEGGDIGGLKRSDLPKDIDQKLNAVGVKRRIFLKTDSENYA
jgi:hypothetical protein